jgi:hypothetical protein
VRSCYWPREQTFGRSVTHQLCICVVPEQGIGCCNITCLKSQISDIRSATFLKGKSGICCAVRSVLNETVSSVTLRNKLLFSMFFSLQNLQTRRYCFLLRTVYVLLFSSSITGLSSRCFFSLSQEMVLNCQKRNSEVVYLRTYSHLCKWLDYKDWILRFIIMLHWLSLYTFTAVFSATLFTVSL